MKCRNTPLVQRSVINICCIFDAFHYPQTGENRGVQYIKYRLTLVEAPWVVRLAEMLVKIVLNVLRAESAEDTQVIGQ